MPVQKGDSDPALRTSWRRQYIKCVLKGKKMSGQGTAGAKATEAQSPHVRGKLQVAEYGWNTTWEMRLQRLASVLEAMLGWEVWTLWGRGVKRIYYSRDPEASPSPYPADI